MLSTALEFIKTPVSHEFASGMIISAIVLVLLCIVGALVNLFDDKNNDESL